ncbi:unnamed protein product [Mytilus coruscus]|uniref:Uncharacterized protein n=1 Tax=Mytilus coruscus TaxID=42192 RepID=A0A6J7ZW23_MYTCO|nr:unnamed protein product [Mytilus coruscus]
MDSHSDCVVAATAQEEGITISDFSEEEIKTGQESDPDLMFILPYLKDGSEPLSNDLFLASPAAKSHWINKKRFFMDDNGVLKSQPKTEGANTRLIVPASLRQTVMELNHELPSAGHQDSESFRSCSDEGSEDEARSWRPSSCNSQPGVGIQPFDTSVLDQATRRRRVRREEPVQEGPVDNTVSLEVPVIPEVSVSREPGAPVLVQGNPEETLEAREEIPAAQEEAPVAKKGEQSAPVPASTTPMAFKKKIPEDQVWIGPYSGYKERTWRVSDRDVACPVPECPVITRHLREHALADHLSPMFETRFSREVMQDQRFQKI